MWVLLHMYFRALLFLAHLTAGLQVQLFFCALNIRQSLLQNAQPLGSISFTRLHQESTLLFFEPTHLSRP